MHRCRRVLLVFGADRSRVIRCAAQQTRLSTVCVATAHRCCGFAGRVDARRRARVPENRTEKIRLTRQKNRCDELDRTGQRFEAVHCFR